MFENNRSGDKILEMKRKYFFVFFLPIWIGRRTNFIWFIIGIIRWITIIIIIITRLFIIVICVVVVFFFFAWFIKIVLIYSCQPIQLRKQQQQQHTQMYNLLLEEFVELDDSSSSLLLLDLEHEKIQNEKKKCKILTRHWFSNWNKSSYGAIIVFVVTALIVVVCCGVVVFSLARVAVVGVVWSKIENSFAALCHHLVLLFKQFLFGSFLCARHLHHWPTNDRDECKHNE